MSNKILVQKVYQTYKGRKTLMGLFVAKRIDSSMQDGFGGYRIRSGWSRVNLAAGDKFEMHEGIHHAFQHLNFCEDVAPLSHAVRDADFKRQYNTFKLRCLKYFQGYLFEAGEEPTPEAKPVKPVANQEDAVIESIVLSLKASIPSHIPIDDKLLREFAVPFMKLGRIMQENGAQTMGGMLNLYSPEQPKDTPENRKTMADAVNAGLGVDMNKTPVAPSDKSDGKYNVRGVDGRFVKVV